MRANAHQEVMPEKVGPKRVNPLLAGRFDIGEAIAQGIESPDELEPEILLKALVTAIYAAAATGKTMLMLWLVKRCLERGERVIIFDMENGPRIISERLRSLGVSPEQADELVFYYPSPNLPLAAKARADFEALLDEIRPALVVFDSWINFLANAGMDENSSNDVARWAVAYTHPARDRGITVLLLDHVPHEGVHARGSTRKKDEVDVMWRLHNTQPFDRDCVGEIVLHREKDREAWLPPSVRFSVGGSPHGFVFERSAGTLEETAEGGLSERQKQALDALKAFGQKGARYSEWQRASGLKETTFDRAKKDLSRRGLCRKADERYFANLDPEPPRRVGVENGISKSVSEYPHEPPCNPHATNGGSGDDYPHNPRRLTGGGGGGNSGAGETNGGVTALDKRHSPSLIDSAQKASASKRMTLVGKDSAQTTEQPAAGVRHPFSEGTGVSTEFPNEQSETDVDESFSLSTSPDIGTNDPVSPPAAASPHPESKDGAKCNHGFVSGKGCYLHDPEHPYRKQQQPVGGK